MKNAIFWGLTTCCLQHRYQRFEGTCGLHRGGRFGDEIMTDAASFSEISVLPYHTKWRHIPETAIVILSIIFPYCDRPSFITFGFKSKGNGYDYRQACSICADVSIRSKNFADTCHVHKSLVKTAWLEPIEVHSSSATARMVCLQYDENK